MNAHHTINNVASHEHWATLHQVPVVLVLQNEHFNADFLDQILRALGFSIGAAFSKSADASEWLRDHNPDVAILDAEMQDGDCPEVARVLHARGIPFVVYSTVSIRGRPADPSLKKGIFLKKPSSRPKILAAVREALALRDGN